MVLYGNDNVVPILQTTEGAAHHFFRVQTTAVSSVDKHFVQRKGPTPPIWKTRV